MSAQNNRAAKAARRARRKARAAEHHAARREKLVPMKEPSFVTSTGNPIAQRRATQTAPVPDEWLERFLATAWGIDSLVRMRSGFPTPLVALASAHAACEWAVIPWRNRDGWDGSWVTCPDLRQRAVESFPSAVGATFTAWRTPLGEWKLELPGPCWRPGYGGYEELAVIGGVRQRAASWAVATISRDASGWPSLGPWTVPPTPPPVYDEVLRSFLPSIKPRRTVDPMTQLLHQPRVGCAPSAPNRWDA